MEARLVEGFQFSLREIPPTTSVCFALALITFNSLFVRFTEQNAKVTCVSKRTFNSLFVRFLRQRGQGDQGGAEGTFNSLFVRFVEEARAHVAAAVAFNSLFVRFKVGGQAHPGRNREAFNSLFVRFRCLSAPRTANASRLSILSS